MNAKCYTFYSYKGGSGRTTTLVNTTKHLAEILNASKEHPILLVDADLESAGLTYFFNCEKRFTARFPYTIHAESFLKTPRAVLTGVRGDSTFGVSRERMFSVEPLVERIARFYPSMPSESIQALFAGVSLRETTFQIMDRIVQAMERAETATQQNIPVEPDDKYFCQAYELYSLFLKLEEIDCSQPDAADRKRATIEEFLPADGMVDVSKYFGLEEGAVKFIGVDVAFNGVHTELDNERATNNKSHIVKECGKKGFSTVIFDCGAGVQSTAHVLNHVSDVIVYCMRPTYQFAFGTLIQLTNYQDSLAKIAARNSEKAIDEGKEGNKKSVILLPTAVPMETEETKHLQKDSFDRIKRIADMFDSFVDSTFCSYETALKEVSLFKWREYVLGTKPVNVDKPDEEMYEALAPYYEYGRQMPADAQAAYNTYKLLAERMHHNS